MLKGGQLKTRITFLYTMFVILLVGALMVYGYLFVLNLIQEKEDSILEDSLDYFVESVDYRVKSIEEAFLAVFTDETFIELYLESVEKSSSFNQDLAFNQKFQEYFMNFFYGNNDMIDSIQFITGNKEIYTISNRLKSVYIDAEQTFYYQEAMAQRNRLLYVNSEETNRYYAMVRSFYFAQNIEGATVVPQVGYQSDKDSDYSILIFSLKKQYLENLMQEESNKRDVDIVILDENRNMVTKVIRSPWEVEYERELIDKIYANDSTMIDGAKLYRRTITEMNWEVIYLYDLHILERQAWEIQNNVFVIFLISFLGIFLIAIFVSDSVVKPIQELAYAVDHTIENNLEIHLSYPYNDEVADLGRKFSGLLKQISILMEEVREVEEQKRINEFRALQAQINPHFLYNTLDMIYWMIKMEETNKDDAANIIADFADFFRLSLNNGDDITSIQREVDHVTKYMEIQKNRMNQKFDYTLEIDPSLLNERIPKLILQPFVENSLMHGFETMYEKGEIHIKVMPKGDMMVFSITDNGCGIPNTEIEQLNLWGRIQAKGVEDRGYAIGNVIDRIYLYTGKEKGVYFFEDIPRGTKVEIYFPLNFKE